MSTDVVCFRCAALPVGRKKIIIEPIPEERNRQVTFMKRKAGLLKKAMELSILCQCEVAVVIFSQHGKLFEYANKDMGKLLQRREDHRTERDSKTNVDVRCPALTRPLSLLPTATSRGQHCSMGLVCAREGRVHTSADACNPCSLRSSWRRSTVVISQSPRKHPCRTQEGQAVLLQLRYATARQACSYYFLGI